VLGTIHSLDILIALLSQDVPNRERERERERDGVCVRAWEKEREQARE